MEYADSRDPLKRTLAMQRKAKHMGLSPMRKKQVAKAVDEAKDS